MKITFYRTECVYNEDGDREVKRERESTLDFESAQEIAEYLVKLGLDQPSSEPDYHHTIWWSGEPYEHPEGYEIFDVEESAHRDEPTVPDAVWREVWVRVTASPADVVRHLVEQVVTTAVPGERVANRANPGDLPRMARELIRVLAGELDESDDLRDVISAQFDSES